MPREVPKEIQLRLELDIRAAVEPPLTNAWRQFTTNAENAELDSNELFELSNACLGVFGVVAAQNFKAVLEAFRGNQPILPMSDGRSEYQVELARVGISFGASTHGGHQLH